MKKYIFTDLACESLGEVNLRRMRLGNRVEKLLFFDRSGREEKRHITFFTPKLWLLEDDEFDLLCEAIADELRALLDADEKKNILAVGLGNPRLTTDSLGAQTIEGLATSPPECRGSRRLMAIAPDVTGNTGIITADAVGAYVDRINPDALIVIDSLRARSIARLASTVQISDGGIVPGSGVGGGRGEISREALGIPVISIGVPTVVSASTLVSDVISKQGGEIERSELSAMLNDGLDFFVMPKEADLLIKGAALLLARAINLAV